MHLTDRQFSEYINRSLNPLELLVVDDHLAGCADCSENLSNILHASMKRSAAVNEIVNEEATHLHLAQIIRYVEQQLEPLEQEFVAHHFESCRACRNEIEDLQAFKQTFSEPPADLPNSSAETLSKWNDAIRHLRSSAG
ncbi:MAG: zf-HC2 domain-containing protein [Blastocatellia bacterium]|nr:zf-HC2 domain-containing protein [Blastocatellia bacterium]